MRSGPENVAHETSFIFHLRFAVEEMTKVLVPIELVPLIVQELLHPRDGREEIASNVSLGILVRNRQ